MHIYLLPSASSIFLSTVSGIICESKVENPVSIKAFENFNAEPSRAGTSGELISIIRFVS